jgi:hypothetical protein
MAPGCERRQIRERLKRFGAARPKPENYLRVTLTDCGSELSKLAGRGFDRVDFIVKRSVSRISTLKEEATFNTWASSGPDRAPNTSV